MRQAMIDHTTRTGRAIDVWVMDREYYRGWRAEVSDYVVTQNPARTDPEFMGVPIKVVAQCDYDSLNEATQGYGSPHILTRAGRPPA